MKILINKLLVLALLIAFAGCSSDENTVDNSNTVEPKIISISTDKTEVLFGGTDEATLTCLAEGGNLKYVWQVDLGDIIPLNNDKSKVKFKASACCVGNKTIKCTVSNDKGSISQTIVIKILEKVENPEISTIQFTKSEIKLSANEFALLSCSAKGGNLSYSWEATCGTFKYMSKDSNEVLYASKAECIGNQTIKCTVRNPLGSVSKSVNIKVVE